MTSVPHAYHRLCGSGFAVSDDVADDAVADDAVADDAVADDVTPDDDVEGDVGSGTIVADAALAAEAVAGEVPAPNEIAPRAARIATNAPVIAVVLSSPVGAAVSPTKPAATITAASSAVFFAR